MKSDTTKKRVLFVFSRDYSEDNGNGRARNINIMMNNLPTDVDLHISRSRKLKKRSNTFTKSILLIKAAINLLIHGLPLQTALYTQMFDVRIIEREIEKYNIQIVYFDSVRFFRAIKRIKEKFPLIRIVVDLDDSMSKRYSLLKSNGQHFSVGFASSIVPKYLERIASGKIMTTAIISWEAKNFLRNERDVIALSDCSVMYSSSDVDWLKSKLPPEHPAHEKLLAIHPPLELGDKIESDETASPRYIYIGSDRQNHNQINIDWLLETWGRSVAAVPLVIYGRQTRIYDNIPAGVTFQGYVEDLRDVYTANSILIVPTVVVGGIKTKVLEAFGAGAAVIGTEAAFEGIPFDCSAVTYSRDELAEHETRSEIARKINSYRALSAAAARHLDSMYSPKIFGSKWGSALVGGIYRDVA